MPSAIRVRLNPLASRFGQPGQNIADGALVSFTAAGPVGSLLALDTPTPAKLTFEGRFIDRVRAQGEGDETRTLATLEGRLVRSSGQQLTLTFTGNKGADGSPEGLVPDEKMSGGAADTDPSDADTAPSDAAADPSDADTAQSDAAAAPSDTDTDQSDAAPNPTDTDTAPSDADTTKVRILRFGFASDQFVDVLTDPTKDTAALLVHMDPTSFRYLEISVTLEIAGAPEAPRSANDVLDVLITAQNPGVIL